MMDENSPALNLSDISTQTAKNLPLSSRVAIFPIGSNEQHGPHLPTGTDTIILNHLVLGVRERLTAEDPFVFLPLLPYGKSPEHMHFVGTISFKMTTLLVVLEDIVASLCAHGVKNIVFLNSHGGNTNLLNAVAYDLRYSHQVSVSCLNLWSEEMISAEEIEEIIPGLDYPEIHAASMETSMLLYLSPELVGPIPQEFTPKTHFPDIPTGWATVDLSYDGVIGDPRKSSAESGKRLYELLVRKTIKRLMEIVNS